MSNCEICKPWMSCQATSLNREISATLVWSCDQNVPGKIDKISPAGYMERDPEINQGPGGVITSSALLGPTSRTVRDSLPWGVSSRPTGLLPPQSSWEEKWLWKWMDESVFRFTVKHFFSTHVSGHHIIGHTSSKKAECWKNYHTKSLL